jgi:hypothetical protein
MKRKLSCRVHGLEHQLLICSEDRNRIGSQSVSRQEAVGRALVKLR